MAILANDDGAILGIMRRADSRRKVCAGVAREVGVALLLENIARTKLVQLLCDAGRHAFDANLGRVPNDRVRDIKLT